MLAGARARERLATSAYTVVCYSVCAVVLAVAALLVERAAGRVQRARLVADRGASPSCAQLLGHTLLNLVLSSVGPTVVSLAVLLEVPGALIVALVLLGQVPPLLALPGMARRRRRGRRWSCAPAGRRRWSSRPPDRVAVLGSLPLRYADQEPSLR